MLWKTGSYCPLLARMTPDASAPLVLPEFSLSTPEPNVDFTGYTLSHTRLLSLQVRKMPFCPQSPQRVLLAPLSNSRFLSQGAKNGYF